MVRLIGVDLPRKRCVEIALTYIYGVGRTQAKETLKSTGVSPDTHAKDLTEDELIKLCDFTQANYKIEGDLRRKIAADIRRKIGISRYRSRHHRAGLPVHGQHIKTNAHTHKGPKRTVAGKKKAK